MNLFNMNELPEITIKTGTWTVENTKTGEHRTFRITRTRKESSKFAPGQRLVELMVGPCNETSFKGFGFAKVDTIVVWRSKSGTENPSSFDFFASMLGGLMGGENRMGTNWESKGYVLKGDAKCYACGRKLTTPESLNAGIGPICAGRM